MLQVLKQSTDKVEDETSVLKPLLVVSCQDVGRYFN